MALQIPDQTIAEVPLNPHVDPMTRISGMLNIQQQRQGIESNDLKLQSQRQANQERLVTQDFMQNNPDKWQNEDGSINIDKARNNLYKVAPLTAGETIDKLTALSKATTEATVANRDMTTGDRTILAMPSMILARQGVQDPKAYISATDYVAQQYPDNPNIQRMAKAKSALYGMMPPGPHVPETALRAGASMMTLAQENSENSPKAILVNKGGSQDVGVSTPSVAGSMPTIQMQGQAPNAPIENTLPPTTTKFNPQTGQMEFVGGAQSQSPQGGPQGLDLSKLSPVEQQFLMRKNPEAFANGAQDFQRTSNASQATRAPIAAGAPADYPELMGIRTAANQAFASVGDSRSNNAQIREVLQNTSGDYLDPTGKGAQALQNLSSKMGFTIAPDSASNYNSIAHNLALQQQTNNQRMGVKTDAGSAISGISSGNADQDRKTLMKAINISDAGNTGIELFNQGMESSIKSDGISSVRAFKNAWSNNYDVNALRLINAGQNKDKEESANVIKLLGGTDSMAYKKARQHAINMEMLSNGQLPPQGGK